MRLPLTMAFILGALLLSGCNDGEGSPLGIGGEIKISGTLTYTFIPVDKSGASPFLDYDASSERPIRRARVELVLNNGDVYDSDVTNGSGRYRLFAPEGVSVRVSVIAELVDGDTNTQVTDGSSVYAIGQSLDTGDDDLEINFNATTSFNGSNYTRRDGAPFAILDTIYECQQTVEDVAGDVDWPLLSVVWSPSTSGSFFQRSSNTLTLLGLEDSDTDEYDQHIVAHEWGHYFMNNFSADDSLGGPHSSGDILDETVAYSEGFANALAGILLGGDPVYADTNGNNQASGFFIDVESDGISDADTTAVSGDLTSVDSGGSTVTTILTDGGHSERTVGELIWDIYDSVDDSETISLGFGPIYDAMTDSDLLNTNYFTSVYLLLEQLKADNPGSAAAIDALAAAENISSLTEYENEGFELGTRYNVLTLPTGATVTDDDEGRTLSTYSTFGTINFGSNAGSRLYHVSKFRAESLAAGTYTITITPTGGNTIVRFFNEAISSTFSSGTDEVSFEVEDGDTLSFGVASDSSETTFTIDATFVAAELINN